MGSLLSAISGQFAKYIVLGTLFPVVVVTGLSLIFVVPLLPHSVPLPIHFDKIAMGEEKWQAVLLTFLVILATGLLYDLNVPIIKLYEGYPWRKSLTGRFLVSLEKNRMNEAVRLRADAYSLRSALNRDDPGNPETARIVAIQSRLEQFLNSELPDAAALVLPTRLGNVIRAFERYPYQAYGIDAIALWPRLVGKIDSAFGSIIDEAKTSFDFMLNMSFLCAISAVAVLSIAIATPRTLTWQGFGPLIWTFLGFGASSVTFYYLSVNRAYGWGQQVKAAFDLYRLDLLKSLGYQQKPASYQEERQIWTSISTQMLFPNKRVVPLSYSDPLTRAIPFPSDVPLQVRRDYSRVDPTQLMVSILLTNLDSQREVKSLTVIDTLPDGYAFVLDSATNSESVGMSVTALSPLAIFLGPIQKGGNLLINYHLTMAQSAPPQPPHQIPIP